MKRLATVTLAGLMAIAHGPCGAAQIERLRGTIEAVDGETVKIRTIDGETEAVLFAPQTRIALLARSSLSAVREGDFIGTATKGSDPPTALEIHIFPESMRGTGEGHRDWDTIPDTLAGGKRVKSAMTNGTVRTGGGPRVKSTMTNGTVASSGRAGDATTLVVTYDKDRSLTILVPPQAPIVAYEPADRSIVQPGGRVFITAERDGNRLMAVRIAVGKDGLTPPQ